MATAVRMRATHQSRKSKSENFGTAEWLKSQVKWLRIYSVWWVLTTILGTTFLFGDKLFSVFDHPITKITVQGQFKHLDRQSLEQSLTPWLESTFFSADLIQVKTLVEQNAWVKYAQVTRLWPGQLVIDVEEQIPVANWGTAAYLNPHAEVFKPNEVRWAAERSMLQGPSDSSSLERQEILSRMYATQKWLAIHGFSLEHLSLNERGTWRLGLVNGPVIELGASPFEARLARAVRTYTALAPDAQSKVASIDTRYPNGVAVAWKDMALAVGQDPRF